MRLKTVILGKTYQFKDVKEVLAKANEEKSGDVLAGIITSFAAQGLELADAAAVGVYIHGHSADMVAEKYSKTGMLPSDVIDGLKEVFADFE